MYRQGIATGRGHPQKTPRPRIALGPRDFGEPINDSGPEGNLYHSWRFACSGHKFLFRIHCGRFGVSDLATKVADFIALHFSRSRASGRSISAILPWGRREANVTRPRMVKKLERAEKVGPPTFAVPVAVSFSQV